MPSGIKPMRWRALALVLLAGCGGSGELPRPNPRIPAPVDEQPGERGRDFGERRRAYFERLHRAAPGVDWRALDAAHVDRSLRLRMQARARALAQGTRPDDLLRVTLGPRASGTWAERGSSNQAGRTIGGAYDAALDRLWVYSHGGNVWRAQRSSLDWSVGTDAASFVPWYVHAFFERLPGGGGRLLIGAHRPSGLWWSDDDGATWTPSSGLVSNGQILDLELRDPAASNTVYVLARGPGGTRLWYSGDRGGSFSDVGLLAPHDDVALFSPRYGSNEVYVLARAQIGRIDPVTHAVLALGTLPGSMPTGLVTWTLSGGVTTGGQTFLYAFASAAGQTRVWRSLDGGVNWSERSPAPTEMFALSPRSAASSTRDPNVLIVGGVNVYRSGDGAASWTLINDWTEYYADPANKLHADLPAVDVYRDGSGQERYFLHTDGGTYESLDGGQTVRNLALSGLNVSQYYGSYTTRSAPYHLVLGSQDQGYQKRPAPPISGVLTFAQTISGDYAHLSATSNARIWSVYPGFAMLDTHPADPSAATLRYWDFQSAGFSDWLFLAPLRADPSNPNRALLAGGRISTGERLIELQYDGAAIGHQELPYDFGSQVTGLAFAPSQPSRVYVITSANQVYRSEDGGSSFTPLASGLPGGQYFYGHAVLVHPTLPARVYVAGAGYSNPAVYVSHDGGATFTPMANGLPNTLVYDLALSADGAHLFAATEVGAYYYDQAQALWIDLTGLGGPAQIFWDVDYVDALQTARFATYGRGLWDFRLSVNDTLFRNGFEAP